MTPEIRQQFAKLEQEIRDLREARDVTQTESIRRRVLQDLITAGVVDNATSNETDSTAIPDAGGTVNHNVQYDKRVRVTIDGTDYYIGLYTV